MLFAERPMVDFLVSSDDTLDLIARAKRGELAALDIIAREQLPRVERLLRRMLGGRSDIDDLVQEVFLELCKSLSRFRGESSFSTFVGGITVHVAQRAMRPTAWQRRRVPAGEEEPESPLDGPDERTMSKARLGRLQIALERLTPPHRVALTLWALEGLDPAVIAEMTGATLSATRSRIFYAQRHIRESAAKDPVLREWLGERDGGDDDAR